MAWRNGHVGDQKESVVALCRNNPINENVRHAIVPPSPSPSWCLSRVGPVVLAWERMRVFKGVQRSSRKPPRGGGGGGWLVGYVLASQTMRDMIWSLSETQHGPRLIMLWFAVQQSRRHLPTAYLATDFHVAEALTAKCPSSLVRERRKLFKLTCVISSETQTVAPRKTMEGKYIYMRV